MLYEKIYLNKLYNLANDPWIEIIVPFNNDGNLREKSKAVIIVPGGGYKKVSNREADPVALSYMNEGFISIVLHYTINVPYPIPMLELAYAIDYLRNNCDKYYIDKDKITLVGFSAGGHLVSSYGYLYKNKKFLDNITICQENIKPNCIVSSYPVITMGEYTHLDSKNIITNNKESLVELLSVEKNVDSNYPPTFVWTTVEDQKVSYINSLLFVEALREANVKHEFFLYPHLGHGLSVINPLLYSDEVLKNKQMQEASIWFMKSIDFIKKILD